MDTIVKNKMSLGHLKRTLEPFGVPVPGGGGGGRQITSRAKN